MMVLGKKLIIGQLIVSRIDLVVFHMIISPLSSPYSANVASSNILIKNVNLYSI